MKSMDAPKQLVENALFQLMRAYAKYLSQHQTQGVQIPENLLYLLMYGLGMVKSWACCKPIVQQPLDSIDKVVYQGFQANMFSPEELQALFSPQIIKVSDPNLSDQEYPPLESLQRTALFSSEIYLAYNGYGLYLFIGRQSDPYFINEIFKVT